VQALLPSRKFLKEKMRDLGGRHNKIFIFTTRYGIYFLSIIFILFLISLSYGHSLAFTTTFVFVSLVMTSAHFTNYNLSGLEVKSVSLPKDLVAGGQSNLIVTLFNSSRKTRFDLSIKVGPFQSQVLEHLAPGESTKTLIPVNNLKRGEYSFSRLKVDTTFPFGLFYSWKFWNESHRFLVLPEKSECTIPLSHFSYPTQNGRGQGEQGQWGAEEFYGHVSYQEGMPLRGIDWRVFARGKGIFLKKFVEESHHVYLIRSEQFKEIETEAMISQMAWLLDYFHADGSVFALVLNGERPEFGSGSEWLRITLKRLAEYNAYKEEWK